MAHFAKIDSTGLVVDVVVVDDSKEPTGEEFLSVVCGLGGIWERTSYNTHANTHSAGKDPFRYNHATIGGVFDPSVKPDGAFIPPAPDSGNWVLDYSTCTWVEAD